MGPKLRKAHKPEQVKEEEGRFITKAKLKLYITLTLASVFVTAFSTLMFLVPFVIDPSLAAIQADFVPDPVECRVVRSQYQLGECTAVSSTAYPSTMYCRGQGLQLVLLQGGLHQGDV